MLMFNGLKFAKNDKEMVNSLFFAGNTCHGFYKKRKNGYLLADLQRKERAFIAANDKQGFFTVSCERLASANNRIVYSHAMCSIEEKWLNMENKTYSEKTDCAKSAHEL